MKTVLAFDMDDTLVDTRGIIYRLGKDICLKKNLLSYYSELAEGEQIGRSIHKLSDELQEFLKKEVIEKREYLRLAKRSPLFNNDFKIVLELLKRKEEDLKIVACSHRGNNKEAFMSSYCWLDEEDVLEYFDMIHSIDNTVHKDKIKFLKETYPSYKVLLVDDNPYSDDKESVLIYDKINYYSKHNGFKTITNIKEILTYFK